MSIQPSFFAELKRRNIVRMAPFALATLPAAWRDDQLK